MEDLLQTVDWSRAQFAMTAIYHWLFVPLTLGLSVLCAIMESIYYRTGDESWRRLTRFWMRLFGINFAIGVATGLILEFEFGTNWSNYSHFVGDIFGAPLAIEGIMAFFMESTFIAIMFFGWKKVSRRTHLIATWLTAFGANISALWILVANAWMQYPVGMTFNIDTVRNEMTSFWDVLLSPMALNKFVHTVSSSFVLAAIFVVGVSAWYVLRNRELVFARRSIRVAATFGFIFAVVTAYSGHRSGAIIAQVQPMKLAAMEAHYDGSDNAALSVIGWVKTSQDTDSEPIRMNLQIPKLLSWMSFGDVNAYVAGINDLLNGNPEQGILSTEEKMTRGRHAIDELARFNEARKSGDQTVMQQVREEFDPNTPVGAAFLKDYFAYFGYGYLTSPQQTVPNVPLLYYSFRVMVGAGMLFLLIFAVAWQLARTDRLPNYRWILHVFLWMIPLAYLGSQTGWAVAEVGRQPWVIQDLMPTTVAVSSASSGSVATTFVLFVVLFTGLLIAEISILCKQISLGPKNE